MEKLRISPNRRYFIRKDGSPFSWLADTDWTMPQRLKWDDALYLMKKRKEQGFTVLQVVALDPEEDLEMRSPAGEPALLAGAFGHTYGHACVWSSIAEKAKSALSRCTWYEALHSEGSTQIPHLRAFMDCLHPQLCRPCQEILPAGNEEAPLNEHLQANVNEETGTVCVYFPSGGEAVIDPGKVWSQGEAWLWWYRPRNGRFYADAETVTDCAQKYILSDGKLSVQAPTAGPEEDWLLIIRKEAGRPPITPGIHGETEEAVQDRKVFEW